jgi:hypothetical protein
MVKPNPRKASIKNVKSMSFICLFFPVLVGIVQAFSAHDQGHTFYNA